jgi:hypothetical protein
MMVSTPTFNAVTTAESNAAENAVTEVTKPLLLPHPPPVDVVHNIPLVPLHNSVTLFIGAGLGLTVIIIFT